MDICGHMNTYVNIYMNICEQTKYLSIQNTYMQKTPRMSERFANHRLTDELPELIKSKSAEIEQKLENEMDVEINTDKFPPISSPGNTLKKNLSDQKQKVFNQIVLQHMISYIYIYMYIYTYIYMYI
jgi:hypothetical protein